MTPYLSTLEAEQYFSTKLDVAAWERAEDDGKYKALCEATRIINRLPFLGRKADAEQENEWPRIFRLYEGTVCRVDISDSEPQLPKEIGWACAEIALALLFGRRPDKDFENLAIGERNYGVLAGKRREIAPSAHILNGVPSKTAWDLLYPLLLLS